MSCFADHDVGVALGMRPHCAADRHAIAHTQVQVTSCVSAAVSAAAQIDSNDRRILF